MQNKKRTIIDIYNEYQIMPNLQIHQLRVAAVAKIICDELYKVGKNVDTENVVKACLLHDMGNIIKFDLTYFPEFTQPEGLEFWQDVKNKYIEKYGNNEHIATDKIVEEITNFNDKIKDLLSLTGFSKVLNVLEDGNLQKMICNYADMRVGPHGILSVKERTDDGRERTKRKTSTSVKTVDFEEVVDGLFKIEEIIFKNLQIKPEDLNDEKIALIIEELKEWEI